MIRFLHTSDWQLGMTRHFLSEAARQIINEGAWGQPSLIAGTKGYPLLPGSASFMLQV
jgi:hypothetical protein